MTSFLLITDKLITDEKKYSYEEWRHYWNLSHKERVDLDFNKTMSNTMFNPIIFDPLKMAFKMHVKFHISYNNEQFDNYRISKFSFFKSNLKNLFMSSEQREEFVKIFCTMQKVYRGFCRMAYLFKYNRTKLQIDHDLYMNPLSLTERKVICIYQNGSKFLFSTIELMKIIKNSLQNSPYLFSEPIASKNPYNNIPFNKSNLYNIYFHVKKWNSVVPALFHQFFLSDFNLTLFKRENENLIRESAIEDIVTNGSFDLLYPYTIEMIYENNYRRKLKISHQFPKDKLIEIFRPYLRLHLKSKYYIGRKKIFYAKLIKSKMKIFIKGNPQFGRARMDIANNLLFNDFHVNFCKEPEKTEHYMSSHLEVCPKEYDEEQVELAFNHFDENYDST